MYSYEIEKLLKVKNYLISNKDYFNILNTSPQISEVRYTDYDKKYYIKTKDNYYFNFKVYKEDG